MQSAYREYHSTDMALLQIHEDLLLSLDRKQYVFMIMLDFSVMFDTVNHQKLFDRLPATYGIWANVHKWIQSYVTDRRQFVTIKESYLKSRIKHVMFLRGSSLVPTCMKIIQLYQMDPSSGNTISFPTSMQMTHKCIIPSTQMKKLTNFTEYRCVYRRLVRGWPRIG